MIGLCSRNPPVPMLEKRTGRELKPRKRGSSTGRTRKQSAVSPEAHTLPWGEPRTGSMRENRLWQPGLCLLCGILGWLPALSTRPARAADEPVFSCDELELWVAVVKLATVYRTNVLLYDQSQDAGQMRALPYCARSMNAGPVTIPEAAMSLEAAVRRMQEEVPAYDFMVRPGTVQILWRDVAHHVLCHRVTVSFKDATDHEVIDILNERIAEMGHPPPGGPRLPGMSLLGFTTRIDFPTPYFRFSHEAVNERIIDILQEVTSRGTPERPFM